MLHSDSLHTLSRVGPCRAPEWLFPSSHCWPGPRCAAGTHWGLRPMGAGRGWHGSWWELLSDSACLLGWYLMRTVATRHPGLGIWTFCRTRARWAVRKSPPVCVPAGGWADGAGLGLLEPLKL